MRVLVLGGTGVISRCIVTELLSEGHEVTVFNRGLRKLDAGDQVGDQVQVIHGDRKQRDQFEQQMKGMRFDVVVDMICFDAEDAKVTLEVFRDVGQVIFCSSVAAYRRPLQSVPTIESAERLFDNPAFSYSFNKAQMERYLHARMGNVDDPAITIIRPSLTYGIGGGNLGVLRQNYNVVERIRKGKPLVMFGDGTNPWNFTFAPDVAKAFSGSVGNKGTYNQCYHATNETLHQWEDLYRELGNIVGREPEIVHIPTEVLYAVNPDLFGHLYYEKMYPGIFDNSKIKTAVPSYYATIGLRDGLSMMLEWYEKSSFPVDDEKDRLEDGLVGWQRSYQ